MAQHFAQINDDSIVINVIRVDDTDAPNEAAGITFCKSLLGSDTNWVQTAKDGSLRFRYAGKGMKYDSSNNVFYMVSPYPSWVLNTSTWDWAAPVADPADAGFNEDKTEFVEYTWDEDTTSWTNRTVVDFS
tara:strand:+ start:37 stop:429 length:393 start_codon:yes stop_codon:yes gene_type:complete